MSGETCDRCGREVEGFAMIGGRRLCHPDYGPSCYVARALRLPDDAFGALLDELPNRDDH